MSYAQSGPILRQGGIIDRLMQAAAASGMPTPPRPFAPGPQMIVPQAHLVVPTVPMVPRPARVLAMPAPVAVGLASYSVPTVSPEESWGFEAMPIPAYLRSSCSQLGARQGLLIVDVIPGSPACVAGIERGDLLIEVDDHPIYDYQALCMLDREHHVMVYRETGLVQLCVKPVNSWLGGNPGYHAPALKPIYPSSRSQTVSVQQIGHDYLVTAVVDTVNGPTSITLRGCEHEIREQLARLPYDIRYQLERHLRF